MARVRPRFIVFVILALLSLGFVQVTRLGVVSVLPYPLSGPIDVPGRWTLANVVTLLVALLLFLLVSEGRGLGGRRPGARWLLVSVLLVGMPFLALLRRLLSIGVAQGGTRTLEDALALVLLAAVAEEFIFRGAVYELAGDLWPGGRLGPLSTAVWLSAGLFALSHFQYHGFLVTEASLRQVALTFPMGLALGYARQETSLIWPGAASHVAINLTHAIWDLWVVDAGTYFRYIPLEP